MTSLHMFDYFRAIRVLFVVLLIAVVALSSDVGNDGGRAQVAAPKGADGDSLVYRAALELTDYNLLFTPVKINGQEARALIDSGSFRAVQLSSTLAQSLKLALTRTGNASRLYEGKEVYPTSGRIESLMIGDYERRDLDLANAPKGAKVSREVTLAERRFTLEFRAKDLTAIRKPLGCSGVIGNNLLKQYAVYFDPDAKVIYLSSV